MEKLLNELIKIKEKDENTIQNYFNDLAKYMFSNVTICAGGDNYTFVEIEFYYHDIKKFNKNIYNCTYPRTCKAGDFFWHNSGVDICFDSKEKNKEEDEEEYFGGILIRCLMKNGKDIIAGPMRCANELRNSCNDKIIIKESKEDKENIDQKLHYTIRCGIKADEKQSENNLKRFCFYIEPKTTWTRTRENVTILDTKENRFKFMKEKRDYYYAQPNKRPYAQEIKIIN